MFMRQKTHALSKSNPWEDSFNPVATPLILAIYQCRMQTSLCPMENPHQHCCVLYTAFEKGIPDQFKLVQQNFNAWFGIHTVCELVDKLFHTYSFVITTDITKINDAIKAPQNPISY